MTTEEIEKRNAEIAKYLGGIYDSSRNVWTFTTTSCHFLQYNSSYDWLMQAVEIIIDNNSSVIYIDGPGYTNPDQFNCTFLPDHKDGTESKDIDMKQAIFIAVSDYCIRMNAKVK